VVAVVVESLVGGYRDVLVLVAEERVEEQSVVY
jgi:hypothetical protein